MFTLKFIGKSIKTVASGERYDVDERGDFAFVIVHQKNASDSGTEFEIGGKRGYDTCFVENLSGKTIDRIGPFDSHACIAVIS